MVRSVNYVLQIYSDEVYIVGEVLNGDVVGLTMGSSTPVYRCDEYGYTRRTERILRDLAEGC